jgi:hypothetical protein
MATKIDDLRRYYETVKRQLKLDIVSDATGEAIHDFALLCLRFLETECDSVPLISLVEGKRYVSYTRRGQLVELSRPANADLFNPDSSTVSSATSDDVLCSERY